MMSLDNVKNILLILSGKGGVGKSSITTQLALSLSLAGHSVGILDIDLTGPSIPRLLGIESAKVKQAPGGWLPVEVHPSQILPPAPAPTFPTVSSSTPSNGTSNGTDHASPPNSTTITNGNRTDNESATTPTTNDTPQSQPQPKIGSLHAMSLAFLLTTRSSAIVWRGPKKTAMVRQFLTSVLWPPLDYLLIDTPPGTSDEHIALAETLLKSVSPSPPTHSTNPRQEQQLSGALIVTTPQAIAISDVRKELNFCAKVGVKVVGVVENMSGYVCECCGVGTNLFSKGGGEVMSGEFAVRFLGRVPLDGQWGRLVEEGRRPVYGGVVKKVGERDGGGESVHDGTDNDNDNDDDDPMGIVNERDAEGNGGGPDDEETETDEQRREEGLLVDKYRSCSLRPLFEDIARKVVETVENGTAVTVGGAS